MNPVSGALVVALLVGACGVGDRSPQTPGTATLSATVAVAAASDLRFALDEIIGLFAEERQDVSVAVSYGSSGNLFAQIRNGAPFDLFMSADIDYPRQLEEARLAPANATRAYAEGRLVVWVRNESGLDLDGQGMAALADPSGGRIAIANPDHAPYGRAAVAALRSAGLYEQLRDRLVFGDNVAQAAQFVESGAADAGIIAVSLALAPPLRDGGRFYLVERDLHEPLLQGGLVLDRAANPAAAGDLLEFIAGPTGWAILERYGFDRAGG